MKKYKVTQEFMDALIEWKKEIFNDDFMSVNDDTISDFSEVIDNWWYSDFNDQERNDRLIAIIQWVNGEDVFEIGTPKYVVGLKDAIRLYGKGYIRIANNGCVNLTYYIEEATRFDNFEKASEWVNKHFEVVEVDE